MVGCIDRGIKTVETRLNEVRSEVQELRAVAATLDSSDPTWDSPERQAQFQALHDRFLQTPENSRYHHMAKVMSNFQAGLFVGADRLDLPSDNLDLERWFRQPKAHERRIHGRCHAGVRLVQEGPTLLLALDAHLQHPQPLNVEDLLPYRRATMPVSQTQAIHRRKIMRKARSTKNRPRLLAELERRYLEAS